MAHHGHGGHGGHGGGRHPGHAHGGGGRVGGPDVLVIEDDDDEDDLDGLRALPPRDFDESAQAARSRSERDPKTRQRITYAHELVARTLLGHPSHAATLRAQGPARHTRGSRRAVRNAGLTMGEAEAAGLVIR